MKKLCFFVSKKCINGVVPVFAFLAFSGAAYAQVVINEIGAFESSDNEWVEVYNAGNEAVDLSGWKFFEAQVNHGITLYSGSSVLEAGEYAVIANKADIFASAKSYDGSLFDSAWSSLREDGEEIGLKNAEGEVTEQFTYLPAPNFSLERANPLLADYTENNWQEHAESHTAGTPNSNFIREDEQTDDSDTDNQDGEDSDQDTEENDSGDSGDPEDDGSSDNPREKRILILQKIRELRRNYLEEFRKLLRQLRSIR